MLLPAMRRLIVLTLLILSASTLRAQVNALSCSSTDVQNAINTATVGQTVNVPAGNCTWGLNSVLLNKAITLNGAGKGVTNITMSAHPSFNITKQAIGITRIQNMTFLAVGPETSPHFIIISGPWPTGDPVIFQNIGVNVQGASMFDVNVAGGAIFSHISFVGTWDNALLTIKDLTHTSSWTTADSLGMGDPTGKLNVYVEDSTFIGGSNGVVDADDNSRIVWRHNTHGFSGQDGGGFNSHGDDSSPYGMRQFEIYNNSFVFPDKTCPLGNSSLSNINQFVWIRGATGVIFNNNFDSLFSSCWGDKSEWKFSNRGAEDDRPGGIPCSAVTYPTKHQLGQNNNGTADFTDPIWIWSNINNAGVPDPGGPNQINLSAGWSNFAGGANPCFATYQSLGYGSTDAQQWSHFFQFPRDAVNTTLGTNLCTNSTEGCDVEAVGGTPKPGYTPFTYPHPLVASQPANPPQPPTGLAASVSGSTVSLSWTASSGTPVPTGYTLYRGTAHNGPYSTVKSGLTSTSTTDTPANGTYFYVTAAFVGGIISGITGNGTTATATCVSTCTFSTNTSLTVAGNSQAAFNGNFLSTGQPTSNTFTFASTMNASGSGGGAWPTSNESVKSNEVQAAVPAALTLSIAPASLTFASRTVGTSSPSQLVTVTNTSGSGSTVTFASVTFGGTNPGDFARSTTCTTLTTPGQQCTANVIFTPSAAGARSALLTFVDNATGSPQTIPVSGTGVSTSPGISLNPTSLDFGQQTLSTTSTARSIIVTNTGSGTLTISSVVASGDFAATTVPVTNCGGSLASLATCSVNITFTPTATGGRSGTLTITDNAAGSPHVAGLTGTGITTKCAMSGAVTLSGIANVCQ
jgi:hypothetical protein